MNILAVGAHWDDIELGCGLTLKRLADNGHKIFSVVVCSSLYGKNENEGMSEKEALEFGTNSFKIIGTTYLATPKQPNSKLTYNKEIMIALEELARENKIDLIFMFYPRNPSVYSSKRSFCYKKLLFCSYYAQFVAFTQIFLRTS